MPLTENLTFPKRNRPEYVIRWPCGKARQGPKTGKLWLSIAVLGVRVASGNYLKDSGVLGCLSVTVAWPYGDQNRWRVTLSVRTP